MNDVSDLIDDSSLNRARIMIDTDDHDSIASKHQNIFPNSAP